MLLTLLLEINCGPLNEPENGFVSSSGTADGDTATFSCKRGFVLEGESTCVCNRSGNWTCSLPECRSMEIYHDHIDNCARMIIRYSED